ncbi:hypothetical protein M885DRAFT_625793 [Pelagophyceae sp. CCMP2097]|nr:hypothetical protein M885DRAFT_625793 [Pelagophyceae sp. CCMP2097]
MQTGASSGDNARTFAAQRSFPAVASPVLQEPSAGHDNAWVRGSCAVATVFALALGSVQSADAAGKDDDSFPAARAPIAAENVRRVSTGASDEESDKETDSSLNEAPQPEKVLSNIALKRSWKTPSGAKADGCALITGYFFPSRKRGRQTFEGDAGSKPKRGRPSGAAGEAKVVHTSPPPTLNKKAAKGAPRTNWSKGADFLKLSVAVEEWDRKSLRCTT